MKNTLALAILVLLSAVLCFGQATEQVGTAAVATSIQDGNKDTLITINSVGSGPIAVSSFTGTSGTLTFTTATQSFASGNTVTLSGFTSPNTGLNGQTATVLTAGLTTTQFEATVTGSGYSSGAGTANVHAVDGLAITNSLPGSPGTVALGATGTDTNVNLNLTTKGSGVVQVNGVALPTVGTTTTFLAMGPNPTTLTSSMVIFGPTPIPQAITVPANGANSTGTTQFILGTLPTATWTAFLQKQTGCTGSWTNIGNGSGSIAFSITTGGVLTTTIASTSFATGDCMRTVTQSAVDTTAANPTLSLVIVK